MEDGRSEENNKVGFSFFFFSLNLTISDSQKSECFTVFNFFTFSFSFIFFLYTKSLTSATMGNAINQMMGHGCNCASVTLMDSWVMAIWACRLRRERG